MTTSKKDLPILFSTPMVEAILELRKRMTRRTKGLSVFNGNPEEWWFDSFSVNSKGELLAHFASTISAKSGLHTAKCPYGNIGDVLWVRETWNDGAFLGSDAGYIYKASENGKCWEENTDDWKWRPSIFMPRDACRIKLEITDIKVERLGEISQEEAMLEGVTREMGYKFNRGWESAHEVDYRWIFQQLWQSINKSYDPNKWVWAVSFEISNTY